MKAKAVKKESERKMKEKIIELSKAIKDKIAKYAKLSFNESSHHECDFNRASYLDDKIAFNVSDKKYYKSIERVDTLTIQRDEVEQRLSKVNLFDRDAFESAFEFEATYVLCCNSKAVSLNLTQHERKYSTLYRHLALFAHRADLYLLTMMSDKQRESAFNSSHFLKAVEIQAKSLTVEQIQKATCSNKKYHRAVEQLKKLMLDSKKAKVKTASLIKAKVKTAIAKVAIAK
jgi:hypothetical protein